MSICASYRIINHEVKKKFQFKILNFRVCSYYSLVMPCFTTVIFGFTKNHNLMSSFSVTLFLIRILIWLTHSIHAFIVSHY